jgi:hypothetical protein
MIFFDFAEQSSPPAFQNGHEGFKKLDLKSRTNIKRGFHYPLFIATEIPCAGHLETIISKYKVASK